MVGLFGTYGKNLEGFEKKVSNIQNCPINQHKRTLFPKRPIWLPKPKDIIAKALGTILTAFEDVNQMEVVKVR